MQTLNILSICFAPEAEIEYEGRTWRFEYGPQGGPWPLRKRDGEPFKRIPAKFWKAYAHWEEQEQHKVQSTARALPTG